MQYIVYAWRSLSWRNLAALLFLCGISIDIKATDATAHFEQSFFGQDITLTTIPLQPCVHRSASKKPWTVIIYMAADNDLRGFASSNIRQMASIGSNEHFNIVIHLDIRLGGNNKTTRRYFVEKGKITLLNEQDPHTQRMDSGNPHTLISCCSWAITNYPAEKYALILWDHGTGCIEPNGGKFFDPADLFSFNDPNKSENARSRSFVEWVSYTQEEQRGICWDATTGNFITNNQLDAALSEIRTTFLYGKKFDLIGFDACLMSMIEVAHIVKKHAHYMVGSQEVELGTGWNYAHAFSLFATHAPTPLQFASNIVVAYEKAYGALTDDYTQSSLDLQHVAELENNINDVARTLLEMIKGGKKSHTIHAIRASANKMLCTHFDEPSYLDLHHFYTNLLQKAQSIGGQLGEKHTTLITLLSTGRKLIEKVVVANCVGKKSSNARGISIYLPERRMHPSYHGSSFAQKNDWGALLHHAVS